MIKKDIDNLLWSKFYKDSFLRILNINVNHVPIENDLLSYLNKFYPLEKPEVIELLASYRMKQASDWKLNLITQSLNSIHFSNELKILDFGCRSSILKSKLAAYYCSNKAVAYDPYSQENNVINQKSKIIYSSFDLIIATFVLHHLSEDELYSEIEWLSKSLNMGGYLFILEDSWDTSDPLYPISREIFIRNEYWSNKWTYGVDINIQPNGYKNIEQWSKILKRYKLHPIKIKMYSDFQYRLHPLHFSSILCKKT